MKDCLQEVSFSRIFAVKQLEELQHKRLVDEAFGGVGFEVGGFEKSQEEFVDELHMRPAGFEGGFVFLGVKLRSGGVLTRW